MDEKQETLQAEDQLAISDPQAYLVSNPTPRDWNLSTQDIARSIKIEDPRQILGLTKEDIQGPRKLNAIETFAKGVWDSLTDNPIKESNETRMFYSSPNMTPVEAERLMNDVLYTDYKRREAETIKNAEQLKYKKWYGFSNGVGSAIKYAFLGLVGGPAAGTAAVGALAGAESAAQVETDLADRYMEKYGKGYTKAEMWKDTGLASAYGVFAGVTEAALGIERIAAGALGRYSKLESLARLVRMQGKRYTSGALKALRRGGMGGLEEGVEELLQNPAEDITVALAGYADDITLDESFNKAFTGALFGAIIGGTMGWGLYRVNRKSLIDKISKWNTDQKVGMNDSQVVEMADQMLDDGKTQMLDEVTTRVEIRNKYGEAYNLVKQRLMDQINATGTVPWQDKAKTKEEYVQMLADTITIPAINIANQLGIKLHDFLEIADVESWVIGNIAGFKPITSVADIDAIIEKQNAIIKDQREKKKLGIGDDDVMNAAKQRKAIAERVRREVVADQEIAKRRSTGRKATQDYIAAKELQPASVASLENAITAKEGEDYVMFAGKKIPVQYEVVELSSIQPSHINGTPNPNYTNEQLQNRASRGTTQDVADLREKASVESFTPERLVKAPTSAEGAPIVNATGEVIAGNGRAEIIRYAYENPETAEKYKQSLVNEGFSIDGMSQPILIRRNTTLTPDEQIAAADISNISETSAFDEASQARRDSKYLADSKDPTEFASKLPMSERRGLMQNNGKWNKRRVQQRYESALLSWLCGNDTQLFERLVLDRGIGQKVIDILTANGNMIYETATKYPDLNIREDIYHALVKMQGATRDNFLELTQQLSLDGHDVMPENMFVWNWLFADSTTNRQFMDYYLNTLTQNQEHVQEGQDLLGQKKAPLSKKDALIQALKKADQAKAEMAASRGKEYEPLFNEDGTTNDPILLSAIASYKNQFAPTEQLNHAAMYTNKRNLKDFVNFALEKKETKQSFVHLLNNGIVYTLTTDTVRHDSKRHKMNAEDWEETIDSLDSITEAYSSPRPNAYGDNNVMLITTKNGKKYGFVITLNGGKNYITTAFKGTEKSIEKWKKDNAGLLSLDLKDSSLPGETMDTSSIPSHLDDIINQLKENVKSSLPLFAQGRKAQPRGQYDPELQTIILGKNWNELTLVHEYHHRYLELLWGYFKQAQAGSRIVSDEWLQDMQKLFQMLEIDPDQEQMTVVQQEKFAYMVEAYLTGLGLENTDNLAFQGFLHWVPEQYKSIMDLGYLDENNIIQNPMLDEESVAWFNKWFASPFAPSLPSAPDAQRMVNPIDENGQIIPSNQKIMNNREKEWGQDSEEQLKADAQLYRAIGENQPTDMRAALDGEEELMKAEAKNLPDDTKLPETPKQTFRERWFKARETNARERAADMARKYVVENPEKARELAFADPETMTVYDAPVDQGMLIRAVMETVPHGSEEWYILNDNLAMVKSMSGSTLALSGDLSHQAYLNAKREVEAARELKAAVNYSGTSRGAMEKWDNDIKAFIAQRTEAILATEPESTERKVAIKAMLEEAKTKFSANATNAILNQLDLTGMRTKNTQVFIKWAEKQIKQATHAKLDTKEQQELMKASIAAQLGLRDIDSTEVKEGKYVRAIQSGKDIRHWQYVKDKMKKAYIGRWGKFGIFMDNLFGSYAPSAMLMSVNTLFFANVPSTAVNTLTTRLAVKEIGKNNVDADVLKGEIKRIKQVFNATGMNLAQMDKPTSPSMLHGEKYTNQEQSHWYNFTFEILGRTDNEFRVPTFVDALARIATKNANGDKARATALFKEYCRLNTTSEEAQIARKQALAVANMAVFTQDGIMAGALNHIRSALNTMSRGALGLQPEGFGLGNILAPFLKTGANITEMGLAATLAPIRTAIAGLQKLQGKEIPDIKKIALISDWINLAWMSVVIAVLAAINSDDDEWYIEPYQTGKQYDPDRPYDSVNFGGVWVKLDIFGPLAIPLRAALKMVNDWEKKKLDAVASGLFFGGMEALSDTPLVQQFTDSGLDYMTKKPGAYWSAFGYNQANKLIPAQVKTVSRAATRGMGIEADTDWMGKTISRKFHRNYGLDNARLTTNDLISLLTNRVKVKESNE